MNKILIICGPTATGKTKLAAKLAKKFNGVLISADSRQVYQDMDIVTGKVRPQGVKIYGYDLVKPDENFSVAHFVKFAQPLIGEFLSKNQLPIIVGGTGLYLNALANPFETLNLPPNQALRKKLTKKTIGQLQKALIKLAPARFHQMNHSDQLNPRRLIRAIEVSPFFKNQTHQENLDIFWLGLTAPKAILDQRIKDNIQQRLKAGAGWEINRLRSQYDSHLPSMSAIGYQQFPDIDHWIQAEQQYARRQLTWFKVNSAIHWVDITQSYLVKVVKLIKTWYTK